jgi:hypothetical protein
MGSILLLDEMLILKTTARGVVVCFAETTIPDLHFTRRPAGTQMDMIRKRQMKTAKDVVSSVAEQVYC